MDNEKLNQVLGGIQNTLLQGFHSQLQDNNGSERNPNGVNDALNHLVTGYWFDTYPLWLKTLDNTAKLSTRNHWPANMVAGMRNHPGQRNERYILIVDCFHYGQTPLDMFGFYGDARGITPMIPWMQAWLAETTSHTVWAKVTQYGDHIAPSALANLQPLWGDGKTAPPAFVQAATVMKIGRENIDLYQAMGLLNMIRETGGNIRESWGKDDSFSQIEGLIGMGNWFYRHLVGIAPDLAAPAFKHFTLRPAVPTRVNSIHFAYDSPRGSIERRFEKNGRQADWKVIVPPNTNATVTFPAVSLDLITESNRPLAGSLSSGPKRKFVENVNSPDCLVGRLRDLPFSSRSSMM